MRSEGWLGEDAVAGVLDGSRIARMAVAGRHGPVVTAQLFAAGGGRLWFVMSRNSVRARVLRVRPQASVLLRSGTRSITVSGRAEILDPRDPLALLRCLDLAPQAVLAALDYGVRNSTRMAGYVADLLHIPPHAEAMPFDRRLVCLTPERGFVWTGTDVVGMLGEWETLPGIVPPPAGRTGRRRLPAAVPDWVASILDGRQPCTVAWETEAGPVALPATWDPAAWRAELPTAVVEAVAPGRAARAAIALDRSAALRPSAYTGLVLRGPARLDVVPGGAAVRVDLALERVSWWAGFVTGTAALPAVRRPAGRRRESAERRSARATAVRFTAG